jgi:hypothetical protein
MNERVASSAVSTVKGSRAYHGAGSAVASAKHVAQAARVLATTQIVRAGLSTAKGRDASMSTFPSRGAGLSTMMSDGIEAGSAESMVAGRTYSPHFRVGKDPQPISKGRAGYAAPAKASTHPDGRG